MHGATVKLQYTSTIRVNRLYSKQTAATYTVALLLIFGYTNSEMSTESNLLNYVENF
jgi:hypothetical protein